MKHNLKQNAEQLLFAASRPELRHSVHYECGLYKSSTDRSPIASACIEHSCALPLLRMIAMIAGIALLMMSVRALICARRKRKLRKQCCTCSD